MGVLIVIDSDVDEAERCLEELERIRERAGVPIACVYRDKAPKTRMKTIILRNTLYTRLTLPGVVSRSPTAYFEER